MKTPRAEKLLEKYKTINKPTTSVVKDAPALLSSPEDIKALATRVGNAKRGKAVFQKFCFACHKAGDLGIDFGPGLSEIGDKLPKSELLLAIVNQMQALVSITRVGRLRPSKVPSPGIVTESDEGLTVRMAGGLSQKVKKSDGPNAPR